MSLMQRTFYQLYYNFFLYLNIYPIIEKSRSRLMKGQFYESIHPIISILYNRNINLSLALASSFKMPEGLASFFLYLNIYPIIKKSRSRLMKGQFYESIHLNYINSL